MFTANNLAERFSEAVLRRDAALFIGSGFSRPSGGPSWSDLFSGFATDLGITLRPDDDLPQLAQFVVNSNLGNRGPLVSAIRDLTTATSGPNALHRAIARTAISTIWTTNYDTLLEETYGARVGAVRIEDSDLATFRNSDSRVEITKIHGCRERSAPGGLVITTSDYDELDIRRPALVQKLRHDLMHRTFLFLGYSYSDPDIRTVMVQASRLAGGDTREHFMVSKKETRSPDLQRRQELWIDDLRRVGIRCALVDEYDDLEALLSKVVAMSRGRTIFPTGSHIEHSAFGASLGDAIARTLPKVIILDGQSQGVSRSVINGFSVSALNERLDLLTSTRLYPNPYAYDGNLSGDATLLPVLIAWRDQLLRDCRVLLAFDGGMGTAAEVEAAINMGCTVVPVPLQEDGSARLLLTDPRVTSVLQSLAPVYLAIVQARKPTVDELTACISEVLEN
ncbi:SIR2 family protein [Subtercola lobariae]|uniref:SIR2-like domain-containing protein n=1 Tax=Subtercola lobariae TaxID=1588641 RepID=A0A917B0W0_9MICO|nr:SIR2 family protein [Subtercola lobariae]GGF15384.1 hypothetical protein GCM10011399_06490 [Subtercola lobariae]